jgi:polyhydroxyalkanoate synthesis repressor PhaR
MCLDIHDAARYIGNVAQVRAVPGVRVVRRYGNRKLYDTHSRRYVTLEGLRRLVADGHDVVVRDQASGEDITAVVLAQVILDGLRERTARIPRQVLAGLVRLGEGTVSVAAEWPPAHAAVKAGQEAERIARQVMGRLTIDEAVALRQEITEALQRGMLEAQRGIQSRLGALLRRLETEATGHPALAMLRAWVAGWAGEEQRRTSWREQTRRRHPGRQRGRGKPRAKPRRPPAARRPRSSATAGRRRSRP